MTTSDLRKEPALNGAKSRVLTRNLAPQVTANSLIGIPVPLREHLNLACWPIGNLTDYRRAQGAHDLQLGYQRILLVARH